MASEKFGKVKNMKVVVFDEADMDNPLFVSNYNVVSVKQALKLALEDEA